MKLGEAMYKAPAASRRAEPGRRRGRRREAKDDVIDAEFREVDDDKKKSGE